MTDSPLEIIQNFPDNEPKVLAPEQVRALEDDYEPQRGYGPFNDEMAEEGGPDGSVFVVGARFEGITGMARQGEDERHGYFIGKGSTPLWQWVLWLCSWDDEYGCWNWCAAAATSVACEDPSKAAEVLLRAFWTKWAVDQDMSAPEEFETSGLLSWTSVSEIISEVFVSQDDDEEEE